MTPPMARPRVAAGAMFFDKAGRVLLVKPTYKERWDIPGGYVEPNETPTQACAREIKEELFLSKQVGVLLAVDWAPFAHVSWLEYEIRELQDWIAVLDSQAAAEAAQQPADGHAEVLLADIQLRAAPGEAVNDRFPAPSTLQRLPQRSGLRAQCPVCGNHRANEIATRTLGESRTAMAMLYNWTVLAPGVVELPSRAARNRLTVVTFGNGLRMSLGVGSFSTRRRHSKLANLGRGSLLLCLGHHRARRCPGWFSNGRCRGIHCDAVRARPSSWQPAMKSGAESTWCIAPRLTLPRISS
jgi:ADP-ribose pyrophosphatase YjhB (NUDIX family)